MHHLYVVRVLDWISCDHVIAVNRQAATALVEETHGLPPGTARATLVKRPRMVLFANAPAVFPSRDQLRRRTR
jgi:hypothetical protein